MNKKAFTYIILLAFSLLLSTIVSGKLLYIAPHLTISASLLAYAFTFLFTARLNEETNIDNTKNILKKVVIGTLIFYLFMIVVNSLSGMTSTKEVTESLRNIFTPNKLAIKSISIYYPNLINLISSILIFYLTHNIFSITFEITKDYTSKTISFIISILISFIIAQMIYISVISFMPLYNESITLTNYIENLTASFIMIIFTSVIMTIIYSIIQKRSKN
ncbi:MAG: hypothetical protein J6K36_03305 [Bacilli bacterium]|nr:hypothetical protein [Bacilli bacterium]